MGIVSPEGYSASVERYEGIFRGGVGTALFCFLAEGETR